LAWGYNGYGQTDSPSGNCFVDIAAGGYNGLAIIAEYGMYLDADLNKDYTVNSTDFAIMADDWLKCKLIP
jgi:hypothetical protein